MTPAARRGWRILLAAGVAGALAVALGAFGAHALRAAVSPDRLGTWQTGASYHLAHALAAGVAGVVAAWTGARAAVWAGRLFLIGIVLFSGSLYALVLLDLGVLGAVAPVGGAAFIAGWIALAVAAWQIQREG